MIRTCCAALALFIAAPALAAEPDGLVLPPGFHASVVADGLKGLRHLAFRNDHQLYASTRGVKGTGILALHLGPDTTWLAAGVPLLGYRTSPEGLRVKRSSVARAERRLEARLLAADTWVDASALQSVDTVDWLLPGDQIRGQRVFGPLREKDKTRDGNYFLGGLHTYSGL